MNGRYVKFLWNFFRKLYLKSTLQKEKQIHCQGIDSKVIHYNANLGFYIPNPVQFNKSCISDDS